MSAMRGERRRVTERSRKMKVEEEPWSLGVGCNPGLRFHVHPSVFVTNSFCSLDLQEFVLLQPTKGVLTDAIYQAKISSLLTYTCK